MDEKSEVLQSKMAKTSLGTKTVLEQESQKFRML